MPYTHITRTKNGAAAIRYARGFGKGHNGAEKRNLYVAGIRMAPDEVIPFEQQMEPFWKKAINGHTTQIVRLIVSYSRDEFDPENPEDHIKCLETLTNIANRLAPGHQVAIFLQNDGEGGLLHGHLLINDVNMETFKGLPHQNYLHSYVRAVVDEESEKITDLHKSELAPEREDYKLRNKKIRNAENKKYNEQEAIKAAEEGRAPVFKTVDYIWKDDLKSRIKKAAAESEDEESFFKNLEENGVRAERRAATKKQPEYYTYELLDTSGFTGKIPSNLKSKSLKLGANYQPDGIVKFFKNSSGKALNANIPKPANAVAEPSHEAELPSETADTEYTNLPMKAAERDAYYYVFDLFKEHMNWLKRPYETCGNGQKIPDYDEIGHRLDAGEESVDKFFTWREQQLDNGIALKDIYIKHSEHSINVDHDELKKQFFEFLRPAKKADENPKNITHEEEIPFLDDEGDEAFRARMHLQDVLRNAQLRELEAKKIEEDGFSF